MQVPALDVAKPMSVGEVAILLGWSVRRVRRFVDKMAKDEPGLVVMLGTHRRISLSVLRRILPDFGKHLLTSEDADFVFEELQAVRASLEHVAKRVGELRAALLAHKSRLDSLDRYRTMNREATARHLARISRLERCVGIGAPSRCEGEESVCTSQT